MDTVQELRIYYGALSGLLDTLNASIESVISSRIVTDYSHIYTQVCRIVDIDLSYLSPTTLKQSDYGYGDGSRDMKVDKIELVSKCKQLRSILENGFNVTDRIVQIGSLFNTIKDTELQSRCSDLLTASDHFDRVVNQSTQILEDRIRKKSGSSKSGKPLIGEVFKSIETSILVLSNDPNEHEGYTSILRGLMQTMRNSSHHSFSTNYTREDAFAVCGFIDQLLRVVDASEVNKV